jgi:hypothetical protein
MANGFRGRVESIKGHVPQAIDFQFPRRVWEEIGESVVSGVIEGIAAQETITGGRIKKNAASTLRIKRSLGRGSRSLVDDPATRRFYRRSSFAVVVDGNGVEVYPKDLAVSREVQTKGYRGWLGLSMKRWGKVSQIVLRYIHDLTKKTKRGKR